MSDNAFVAAAEAAAEEEVTPVAEVSGELLATLFLRGLEGVHGTYRSDGKTLYNGETVVARITPNGTVLLPTSNLDDVEFNDTLMRMIFTSGRNYRRIPTFRNLMSPDDRTAELDRGEFDNFKAIASLFDFSISADDIAALERAKAFRASVAKHFGDLQEAEAEKIRIANRAAAKTRAEKARIAWDDGDGPSRNRDVTGAGGGQRLRAAKFVPGTAMGRRRVHTSHGNNMTMTSAKRAFDFASKYWHGGERFPSWSTATMRNRGGYGVEVTENRLNYGCQNVTRQEAERFADAMGWDRAVPSA